MTVSTALGPGACKLRPKTVETILKAATELGYNPSRSMTARRLRYSKDTREVENKLVAFYFALQSGQSLYHFQLLKGIGEVLNREGFALLSNWTRESGAKPSAPLPAIFTRGEVDGVLTLSGMLRKKNVCTKLRKDPGFAQRPIVSMNG